MSKKIAITGKPGCGKTTLCKKVFQKLDRSAGGLITEEIRKDKKRIGFQLKDLSTRKVGLLSHTRKCSGPRVGRYSVCIDQLDSLGTSAVQNGVKNKDLLIIDEIGPMELKSQKFIDAVKSSLKAETDCLFSIHRRSNHPLLKTIREKFQVKKLTKDNRNEMLEIILSTFK